MGGWSEPRNCSWRLHVPQKSNLGQNAKAFVLVCLGTCACCLYVFEGANSWREPVMGSYATRRPNRTPATASQIKTRVHARVQTRLLHGTHRLWTILLKFSMQRLSSCYFSANEMSVLTFYKKTHLFLRCSCSRAKTTTPPTTPPDNPHRQPPRQPPP